MKWKKAAFGGVLLASGSLVWGSARDLRDFQDLATRVGRLLEKQGDVRAQATFPEEVVVTNFAGVEVAGMGADEVGDGLFGLARGGSAPAEARVRVVGGVTATDAGLLAVADGTGTLKYGMDGLMGFVTLTGDLAEAFPADRAAVPSGSVMVIDPDRPGALRVSEKAYDSRVAGIAAGAKGYRPGMTLRALADLPNAVALTLSGTTYCLATNANGPIRAGDLLTSSGVPGHAMRVADHAAARGAILGKALEDLKGDRGLVLTLASLQ